jgi:hypothetical protein
MAESEFGREFRNICGHRAGRIALQEAADCICPSARLIPKCFVNLVGEGQSWQAHEETPRARFSHKVTKSKSHYQIKCPFWAAFRVAKAIFS